MMVFTANLFDRGFTSMICYTRILHMDFSGQGLQSQHADFISRDQLFPVDEMELFSRSRASETKVSRL